MRTFLVDSNFFIQAHRINYPMDVVPSFWNKVATLANDGNIISIDKVKNEIYQNQDDLKNWYQSNLPNTFFKNTTSVMAEYGAIAVWAGTKASHYKALCLS